MLAEADMKYIRVNFGRHVIEYDINGSTMEAKVLPDILALLPLTLCTVQPEAVGRGYVLMHLKRFT